MTTTPPTCERCGRLVDVLAGTMPLIEAGFPMPTVCIRCMRIVDLLLVDGSIVGFDAGSVYADEAKEQVTA